MSQWAELRHQHFVDGVPKKALARRFGLDVKTVRRALDRAEPPRRAAARRPRLLVRATPAVGEAAIEKWKEAGLLKPSVLKPLIATVEKQLVLRKLGRLEEGDRRALRGVLNEILGERHHR